MKTPSHDPAPSAGPADECPDTRHLAALLRDTNPEQARAELALHLERCPVCRRRLDELAGFGKWIESLASGDEQTRSAIDGSRKPEPQLLAVMDALRQSPPTSGRLNEPMPRRGDPPGGEDDLGFLTPVDLPGYIGRLGPYDVIEVVGRGGMGIVLKAHDPSLGRIVAIKVMSPVLAASNTARKRFVREARAAAAVSHEHVVTIHAVDEANGLPYIVMQFVAGRSLDARIREGPLPTEEVLRIGMQAAAGLAAAHAQGLIHRDIKPANIMLENGVERVKIADFGLAHAADEASVTVTGQVSGTPSFMAPEQARGERVDQRADLFSLGCVLYAMCAGRPPFAAPTPLSALRAVCDEEPPPLREVNPQVPPGLAEIVYDLMRKDPSQRPASAADVADTLGRHFARLQSPGGDAGDADPAEGRSGRSGTSAKQRTRRRPVLAAASIAALCLVGLCFTELTGVTGLSRWLKQDAARGRDDAGGASPVAASGPAEIPTGRFAVLSAANARARAFASLADAVQAASHGDTIELRHNDVVASPRVDLGRKSLRIRSADGFRPTLAQAEAGQAILTSSGALVLEGITLEGAAAENTVMRGDDPGECVVVASGGPVYLANCRFVVRSVREARFSCLRVSASPVCEILNTELHGLGGNGVQWLDVGSEGSTLRLDNVVHSGRTALVIEKKGGGAAELSIDGSSFLVQSLLALLPGEPPAGLTVNLKRSVVAAPVIRHELPLARRTDRFDAVKWTDTGVIYDTMRRNAPSATDSTAAPARMGPERSASRDPGGATEADVRFAGDFRRMQAMDVVPQPANFALQGIRFAGGRMAPRRLLSSVGANIGLVGPGEAYETFRKSSDYAAWRDRADDALRQPR